MRSAPRRRSSSSMACVRCRSRSSGTVTSALSSAPELPCPYRRPERIAALRATDRAVRCASRGPDCRPDRHAASAPSGRRNRLPARCRPAPVLRAELLGHRLAHLLAALLQRLDRLLLGFTGTGVVALAQLLPASRMAVSASPRLGGTCPVRSPNCCISSPSDRRSACCTRRSA